MTDWQGDGDQDVETSLVLRKGFLPATPTEITSDSPSFSDWKTSIAGWFRRVVLGQGADELQRLKEAKYREIEAPAEESAARARKLDAEAELLFAQAERERAATRKLNAESALSELEAAIRAIELKGGQVWIDDPEDPTR